VGVEDDPSDLAVPDGYQLKQNFSNPFNPTTTIEYSLPRRSRVTLQVYNMLGQKIRTLVDCEESAGSYTITWDGRNAAGEMVSTGVYLYRLQADDFVESKKMLLLK
jgi:flagellar hook assembly protein FlgD